MGRALLAILLVAGLLAAGLRLARRAPSSERPLPVPEEQAPANTQRAVVQPQAQPETSREAVPPTKEREVQAPAADSVRLELTLRIVGPERERLKPEHVRVRLVDARGTVVEQSAAGADTLVVTGLAPGRYVASADATGFVHRAQVFELAQPANPDETLAEDLVLWPAGRVAVVVRTDDGRPFSALAADLGMEPKRLFVDAFRVRAFQDASAAEDPLVKSDARSKVEFRPPPQYQQWELSEGVVGSLVVLEPAACWVRLEFHGQPVDVEKLELDAREVVFRLSSAAMRRCFAHLRLRVFEAQGDSPVAHAEATLRADTSAHRRRDQERIPTADDGLVEFARIVPGRYELTVQRGEALYQDRIDLAAGEQRDLGIVRLPDGAPLRIRVVDERGEPLRAWLEIGPFQAGQNVHELYPPMLHEVSDAQGKGRLPMPARASIVRAQRMDPQDMRATGQCSANVRLDPAHPPADELELVILDEARVRLACKLPEARRLRLLDESGLIVFDGALDSMRSRDGRRELVLGHGRYDLRLLGAAGELLHERAVELRAGEQELELP